MKNNDCIKINPFDTMSAFLFYAFYRNYHSFLFYYFTKYVILIGKLLCLGHFTFKLDCIKSKCFYMYYNKNARDFQNLLLLLIAFAFIFTIILFISLLLILLICKMFPISLLPSPSTPSSIQ